MNDQLHYNFGNETDGWYYGGASWMKGLPLLAGTPAPDAASAHPQNLPRAFRDNLQMILGTEFEPGLTRFGYNSAGGYTDDNIIQIIGGRAYYLYSGDLAFVRQHLPCLSPRGRVVSGTTQRRRARLVHGRRPLVLRRDVCQRRDHLSQRLPLPRAA